MVTLSRKQWLQAGSAVAGFLVLALLIPRSTALGVDVQGTVFVDGQPLPGATVFFIGQLIDDAEGISAPFSIHGMTDASGVYRLVSPVAPGEYRVAVRGLVGADSVYSIPGLGEDGVDAAQLEAAVAARESDQNMRWHSTANRTKPMPRPLPVEYSDATQTVLHFTVPESGTDKADLHLTMSGNGTSPRIAFQQ